MFGGDFASDMAINGANRRANEWADYAGRVEKRAEVAEDANAANLAVRCALAAQLARVDPDNPLFKDNDLQDQVQDAGSKAYADNGCDYDKAREAGCTFIIPGRTEPYDPLSTISPGGLMMSYKDVIASMRRAFAGAVAHEAVLTAQLASADPDNPLLKNAFLVENIRTAGAEAYTLNGESFDAAREAGSAFNVPGRK